MSVKSSNTLYFFWGSRDPKKSFIKPCARFRVTGLFGEPGGTQYIKQTAIRHTLKLLEEDGGVEKHPCVVVVVVVLMVLGKERKKERNK
jgi:hypothetical protein